MAVSIITRLVSFNWDRFGLESLPQINYALLRIQPEIAAENGITEDSMLQSIIDFYKCYNGTEITEQQAGYMLSGLCPDGSEPVLASGGQGGGQGGKK